MNNFQTPNAPMVSEYKVFPVLGLHKLNKLPAYELCKLFIHIWYCTSAGTMHRFCTIIDKQSLFPTLCHSLYPMITYPISERIAVGHRHWLDCNGKWVAKNSSWTESVYTKHPNIHISNVLTSAHYLLFYSLVPRLFPNLPGMGLKLVCIRTLDLKSNALTTRSPW